MGEFSILIGGQAGDGIKQAGNAIARVFNRLGYWIFVYEDYPSLIRGGHNFAIVRASSERISSHRDGIDVLVALNQEALDRHSWRLREGSMVIFDSDMAKAEGLGIPMSGIVKRRGLPAILRNAIALGALAAALGISLEVIEDVIKATMVKRVEENLEAAREGYGIASGNHWVAKSRRVERVPGGPRPLLTGNEALALGLARGGMKLYVAYPMTPTSSLLHYIAAHEDELGAIAIHPESEIAVIGIAQGAAYAGVRSAVGTSGGGFSLMVEHISLAGQAEIPTVIVLGQRLDPATGAPTYTKQGNLFFAMFAGHGEFPRAVLAPGDADEAFNLAVEAMNLAWRFQIPVIILSDKHLSESTFSFDLEASRAAAAEPPKLWDGMGEYGRYAQTEDGISPLAFPGEGAVVKANSYEHDEFGITTEDAGLIAKAQEKRLRKARALEEYVNGKGMVSVEGDPDGKIAFLFWGSTKGAAVEVAKRIGARAIQPLCLMPLPKRELEGRLEGAERVVGIEGNSMGQFCGWLRCHGIQVDEVVLKYDGRPFAADELERKIRGLLG
ncbi:MAG: 2-oxoacid:acceptor oxidoreductase subunit alpha [Candidatus Bathyarchaeia archaeon]